MTLDPGLLPLATLLVGASTLLTIVKTLVMILFVLSAIVLIAVVLLQEGKGGGLAGAFGGAAADTFGVKAGTINRFTTIVASMFIGLALFHAGISAAIGDSLVRTDTTPSEPPSSTAPVTPPATPPAMEDGSSPPAGMGTDGMDGGEPPAAPPTAPPPPADGMDGESPMGDSPPAPPAMDDPPK